MLFGANHTWLDGGERDPFCGVTNESRFQSMGPINHACHLHCSTLNPRTNCSIIQNEIHTHTHRVEDRPCVFTSNSIAVIFGASGS